MTMHSQLDKYSRKAVEMLDPLSGCKTMNYREDANVRVALVLQPRVKACDHGTPPIRQQHKRTRPGQLRKRSLNWTRGDRRTLRVRSSPCRSSAPAAFGSPASTWATSADCLSTAIGRMRFTHRSNSPFADTSKHGSAGDALAGSDEDFQHRAGAMSADLIFHFHGFDNGDQIASADDRARFDRDS